MLRQLKRADDALQECATDPTHLRQL